MGNSDSATSQTGSGPGAVRRLLGGVNALAVRRRNRTFKVGVRAASTRCQDISDQQLADAAHHHLGRLSARTGASTAVAVLDGTDCIYLSLVEARQSMTPGVRSDGRFPAFATSGGQVLLAQLDDKDLADYLATVDLTPPSPCPVRTATQVQELLETVSSRGWVLTDIEPQTGRSSLAVPLRAPSGQVIAALSASVVNAVRPAMLSALISTAAAIETGLTRPSQQFDQPGYLPMEFAALASPRKLSEANMYRTDRRRSSRQPRTGSCS